MVHDYLDDLAALSVLRCCVCHLSAQFFLLVSMLSPLGSHFRSILLSFSLELCPSCRFGHNQAHPSFGMMAQRWESAVY
jgi:hypothetical protein